MSAANNYIFNTSTLLWERINSIANNADAMATQTTGLINQNAFLRGWNGTTFDRIRSGGNTNDNVAPNGAGILAAQGFNYLYSGDALTAWERARSANAAQLASTIQIGMAAQSPPGQWSVTFAGTAGAAATISKAAGGAGTRHIITSIAASLTFSGIPAAVTYVTLNTGGGVVWQHLLGANGTVGANAVNFQVVLSGLNIVCVANAAATLAFSAATSATALQCVSMTGYTVQ